MTYTAYDPHYFWDGKYHHWDGMSVNGMEYQPDYQEWWDTKHNRGKLTERYAKKVKAKMKSNRWTYKYMASQLGVSISFFEHIISRTAFVDKDTKAKLKTVMGGEPQLVYPEGLYDGFKPPTAERSDRARRLCKLRESERRPKAEGVPKLPNKQKSVHHKAKDGLDGWWRML